MADYKQANTLREEFGFGMLDAKRAFEIAEERFAGDVRLGALWVHANAFAINVKGGVDARAKWNDEWARSASPTWGNANG